MTNFTIEYDNETKKRISEGILKELFVNGETLLCPLYEAVKVKGTCFIRPGGNCVYLNKVLMKRNHEPNGNTPKGSELIGGVLCSYPTKL
jgi:hypothetical protein